MIELDTKWGEKVKIFTDNIEESALGQVIQSANSPIGKNAHIRIMPDCHSGAGCVIGTTKIISDKVCPNEVGVDIGCGMRTVKLGKVDIDLVALDNFIGNNIPNGFNNYKEYYYEFPKINNLICKDSLPKHINEYQKAIGTLGGGNHFIEVAIDDEENKYLVIHTGSRNLGLQIAKYYQELAIDLCMLSSDTLTKIPKELSYLEGKYMENYLHDMDIAQQYAYINRSCIELKILKFLFPKNFLFPFFDTVHNYIDMQTHILRKGAVSAKKNEKLLIPLNMRDGSIIAIGKGNEDWNCSAPHGAGRIMSRGQAKSKVSLVEFKESMKDVYSTSISINTLDESPMVYKPIDEILSCIGDTVDIYKIIKPIYNFKAGK